MRIPNLFNMFGSKGGLTILELESLSARSKVSDYLPWLAYDPKKKIYINTDGTEGYLWECAPLAFAGLKSQNTLKNLIQSPMLKGSILQYPIMVKRISN